MNKMDTRVVPVAASRIMTIYHQERAMSTTHPTAKDQAIQVLRDQPDDSSLDELIHELQVLRSIERGLADSDAGRVISHDEMKRKIESWQK